MRMRLIYDYPRTLGHALLPSSSLYLMELYVSPTNYLVGTKREVPSTDEIITFSTALFTDKIGLKENIIQFIGDPVECIQEDPHRIIRVCGILAATEGVFHPSTLRALQQHSEYFLTQQNTQGKPYIARNEIYSEILLAMELPKPSLFFAALQSIGALKFIFPELEDTVHHPHGRFHKETIWDHCMLVGDHLSPKRPLLRLAGYLHDIGKPASWLINEETSFRDHAQVGADQVYRALAALNAPYVHQHYVSTIVRQHMREFHSCGKKGARRILHDLGPAIDWRDVVRHQIADVASNLAHGPYTIKEIKRIVRKIRSVANELRAGR